MFTTARRDVLFAVVPAITRACLFLTMTFAAQAQEPPQDWQAEARRYAQVQDWSSAAQIVNAVLARSPKDIEARAWQARLLLWSGRVEEAENGFLSLTRDAPRDPDMWQGLASVYARQARWEDALGALDHAVEIAPDRADLRIARAQALRALNRRAEAREEFLRVLKTNASNEEAKRGLLGLQPPLKHELRTGTDTDLFNYTGAYEGEWMSLVSHWTPHWITAVAGNFYQRNGPAAEKFVGSVTRQTRRWGALTVGGAVAHDGGIIPKSEAFFGFDRGWRISERGFVRGVEATYEQHWYWYSSARILTITGGTLVYLPREWLWSINLTGVRNGFPALPVEWRPSGATRISFPLSRWGERRLSGNVSFAVGTEDFALVDQIGSFSSQTYAGGWSFRLNAWQDVTGYAAFQQRTRGHTQTSFGFSYAIHF
jgi:tetratricopeptide (TPR) repeat protein